MHHDLVLFLPEAEREIALYAGHPGPLYEYVSVQGYRRLRIPSYGGDSLVADFVEENEQEQSLVEGSRRVGVAETCLHTEGNSSGRELEGSHVQGWDVRMPNMASRRHRAHGLVANPDVQKDHMGTDPCQMLGMIEYYHLGPIRWWGVVDGRSRRRRLVCGGASCRRQSLRRGRVGVRHRGGDG